MAETLRGKLEKRSKALKDEFTQNEALYKQLRNHFAPTSGRFEGEGNRKMASRFNTVIDGTPLISARTLKSGMLAGFTSPSRPWFVLSTPDPDLMEFKPAQEWLFFVQRLMNEVFHRSNLYNILPLVYKEGGVFGTGCMTQLEDFDNVARFQHDTIGQYYIAENDKGVVDTKYKKTIKTVNQLMTEFGEDNVSRTVKSLYDNGKIEEKVNVMHVIEPNDDRIIDSKFSKNLPFRSVYYEIGSDEDKVLKQSGYHELPFMCQRWETLDGNSWGNNSPAMETLGDTKQLQHQQKKKAQAIEKMVTPPLTAPASLKGKAISSLPGDVTYTTGQGEEGVRAMYEVNPRINELKEDIYFTQGRIQRGFYEDLFLMLSQSDRRQITATEVAERHEEKLLQLAPVLEQVQTELLKPLIDRTFNMMLRAGMLPPPPPELAGVNLKVEYISIMAQAQKLVNTGSLERVAGFTGNLATLDPSVIDKLNLDNMVDEFSNMVGTPPNTIRTDDEVQAMRQARNQQAQLQQGVDNANAIATAAKTMSETEKDGQGGLADVLNPTG